MRDEISATQRGIGLDRETVTLSRAWASERELDVAIPGAKLPVCFRSEVTDLVVPVHYHGQDWRLHPANAPQHATCAKPDRETDLDESLLALNQGVQDCVALDTTQYLWAYKRFKTRPEGEPPFYR